MSAFPYSKDIYREECVEIGLDKNYMYALKVIDILSGQLKYIMIDGKNNYDIIEKYLLEDYRLVDKRTGQVNKKRIAEVHLYRHSAKELYLIYFSTFLRYDLCKQCVY